MCTSSVGNVIYHKYSHGAAFYMLNGKNINAMLELRVDPYLERFLSSKEANRNLGKLFPLEKLKKQEMLQYVTNAPEGPL